MFCAEGEKVVRRLFESDFTLVSLLLQEKWLREYGPLIRSRPEAIPVYVAEKRMLEELTGFSMFQGVLAVGKIPRAHTVEAVLQRSVRPYLFAAGRGVDDAQKLQV